MRTLITLATALLTPVLAVPAIAQQPGVPSPEAAQAQGQPGPSTQPTAADVGDIRVNQIVIFEGDTCPPSTDEVINVCAVLPSSQRFRIPENLRNEPNAPVNQAWANRARELSFVGAAGIGSCSPTGPGGIIGCQNQLINQAVAERRGRPDVNWARLIEEARQTRLAGIQRASGEEEATAGGNRRVQELRIAEGQECPPSTEAVIIVCTTPSGRAAPQQAPGEPQFPTTGVTPRPAASTPSSSPPR